MDHIRKISQPFNGMIRLNFLFRLGRVRIKSLSAVFESVFLFLYVFVDFFCGDCLGVYRAVGVNSNSFDI
jgi:hypothetical protein